jgi:excisionase family DNA binding protein
LEHVINSIAHPPQDVLLLVSPGQKLMNKKRQTRNASWVASHLGTSHQTVGRMIDSGELEAYKLRDRGRWHIFLDSVEALEKKINAKYCTRPSQPQEQRG